MGYELTQIDLNFMHKRYPRLCYIPSPNTITGTMDIDCKYKDSHRIKDHFEILIEMNTAGCNKVPTVYNIDHKICRLAILNGVNNKDFHVYGNDQLCLLKPDKFNNWYPHGFKFRRFMDYLERYLYWVCYKDRYGVEPWPGEKHGW